MLILHAVADKFSYKEDLQKFTI